MISMRHYEIFVKCVECGGEHPMRVRIHLEDGPIHRQSVKEAYSGKIQPPQLQAVEQHKVLCLKTGVTFTQTNPENVFLVPTSEAARR
jgi:hypothetical protein